MENRAFCSGGSTHIAALIQAAIENGTRTATVTGNWLVAEAVRIPSNFTLILHNCHLRQATGCFSNIFVNEHHNTPIGGTPAGRDRNISIVGRGQAVLDGGDYNGLCEFNSGKDGWPHIWNNSLVFFTNVDGFKISGIHCSNQRWWALTFVFCANGYIGNIDFCASDLCRHENGSFY